MSNKKAKKIKTEKAPVPWSDRDIRWDKLDNTAHLFPVIAGEDMTSVYRISVTLKEEIDPEILREALGTTLRRIPSLNVKMRKGFFWNYLEKNDMECPINHDIKNHCYRIHFKENNGYLFRVYYNSTLCFFLY